MHWFSSHCDQGPRENLEDAALTLCVQRPGTAEPIPVCLVTDGVGGHRFGEVASNIALQIIATHLTAQFAMPDSHALSPDQVSDTLIAAFHKANNAILQAVEQQPHLAGMSTTAVCSVIVNDVLFIAWCGDSRGYVIIDESIEQLTTDHSEVQRLIEAGLLDPQEAKHHPLAHTINRFLGSPNHCQPEIRMHRLHPTEVVLLCSDGLTDVVPDPHIAELATAACQTPSLFRELAHQLVTEANHRGTIDNVTVVCHTNAIEQPSPNFLQLTQTDLYHSSVAHALQLLIPESFDE